MWALEVKNLVDRLTSRFAWYNPLGKGCNFILKVEHSHSLYLSNPISWNKIKIKSRDMNNDVYSSAVHNIAKTWKQPKCSLTEEWINKV